VLALLVSALFAAAFVLLPHSPGGIRALAGAAGPLAPLALLALWTAATPALVSGTLLAAASGLLLGPLEGGAVAIIGAVSGGTVALYVARAVGRESLGSLGTRAGRVAAAIENRGFRSVLCLRAAPGVPATIVNYAAGLTRIRTRDFVAATLIGGAPRAIAYSALGASAGNPSPVAVALPTAILVLMAVAGAFLARSTFRMQRIG
jgi:uncharacterized membrane protein YdjX (TVP38/TMEM64 family)